MAAISSIVLATAAASAAGIGLSAYGTATQVSAAKHQAEAQQQIIEQQQRQEALRQRAMELDARRRMVENLRQAQRVRAMSLATTTAQGSIGDSSALGGAYGQASGQYGTNLLGISQNLEIGRGMFASNYAESLGKIAYANAGSQMAFGAGLSSLGNMLVSSAGTIGNIAGGVNFGASSSAAGGYPRPTYSPGRIGSFY